MNRFEKMSKDEAIEYCYENKDRYIKSFDKDGYKQFDCLIAILKDDTIKPDQLPEYGMKFNKKKEKKLNGKIHN